MADGGNSPSGGINRTGNGSAVDHLPLPDPQPPAGRNPSPQPDPVDHVLRTPPPDAALRAVVSGNQNTDDRIVIGAKIADTFEDILNPTTGDTLIGDAVCDEVKAFEDDDEAPEFKAEVSSDDRTITRTELANAFYKVYGEKRLAFMAAEYVLRTAIAEIGPSVDDATESKKFKKILEGDRATWIAGGTFFQYSYKNSSSTFEGTIASRMIVRDPEKAVKIFSGEDPAGFGRMPNVSNVGYANGTLTFNYSTKGSHFFYALNTRVERRSGGTISVPWSNNVERSLAKVNEYIVFDFNSGSWTLSPIPAEFRQNPDGPPEFLVTYTVRTKTHPGGLPAEMAKKSLGITGLIGKFAGASIEENFEMARKICAEGGS